MALLLTACHDEVANPNHNLSLDYYASLDTSAYRLNSRKIREEIGALIDADADSLMADHRAKSYYLQGKPFVWIDRKGIDHRADTLLACLQDVRSMGFSARRFHLPQLERDLERVRRLDFDTADNRINKVMARLEYRLTKAYLRYVAGQQFGFVNPSYLFNHLDVHDTTAGRRSYNTLFALKIHLPSRRFFDKAFGKVKADSVGPFLREVQPTSPFYYRLQRELAKGGKGLDRTKVMVNMERCRWRMDDYPQAHKKYVLVNIPSYHLRAVDGDHELQMRIGCGSLETKTPLLASRIRRIDINPQWIMPRSIIRKSIVPRLGNRHYFDSHRYFIRERSTGKKVDVGNVSREMLEGGEYLVIQEGGEGNALGRIIFRFDNALSIYLHDTSSRDVFALEDRGVSHGCVRVERPYDLALFVMGERGSKVAERIGYSIRADVSALGKPRDQLTDQQRQVLDTLRRDMLIGSMKVEPIVPVYILYYTLYPDKDGRIEEFRDVYGYDKVIAQFFRNLM